MANTGQDIIDIGSTRVGQSYVLGAVVPLDNPNWKGPWDCAEFTSWCAFQAYDGMVFGAGNPKKVSKAEPFSGHWFDEAKKSATIISIKEALSIPGAVLIRKPTSGKIGHVAFSMGDGERTLEARGKAFGVGIFKGAASRPWGIGALLPGVEYGGFVPTPGQAKTFKPEPLPAGFLFLKIPNFKGGDIVALQKALASKGIDPGPIDGEYGPMTNAAIISLQVMKGLEVDGIVGPVTAEALGLSFPIPATAANMKVHKEAETPTGPQNFVMPPPPAAFDGISGITQVGKLFKARTSSGFEFVIGSSTSFTDDMNRVGLFQGSSAINDSMKFGTYDAADFTAAFGQWAHFIEPTLTAEGGARFATLNTYDRAAFTFGAPQLAAHTPNENFIVYLRQLLELPDADKHFPELSLRDNGSGKRTVHLAKGGSFEDLEKAIEVVRPNGKKEVQLPRLMTFLNASPTKIDEAELSAAARLMNWLRLDPKAKELQINVFIGHAKDRLARAKTKVSGFDGADWRKALWIMDIMHQGRGDFAQMSNAMKSGNPGASLKMIGAGKFAGRIKSVASAMDKLEASGVMNGFTV